MYITAIATNTLTVVRAVNGTTAATHVTAKAISVYEYPSAISEACLMMAARLWKRKDSSFATIIGVPEVGTMNIFRGLDLDVKLLLEPYIAEVAI